MLTPTLYLRVTDGLRRTLRLGRASSATHHPRIVLELYEWAINNSGS